MTRKSALQPQIQFNIKSSDYIENDRLEDTLPCVIRNVALLAAFMHVFRREVGQPQFHLGTELNGARGRGAEGTMVEVQKHQLK